MPTPRSLSPRLERGMLFLGGAVAVLLFGVAFFLRGAPRAIGEAELADSAGRVADEVERTWRRLRLRPEEWLGETELTLRWTREGFPQPPTAGVPREEGLTADATFDATFDALFDESRRKERQGDVPEALSAMIDALARDIGPVRRAQGELAALQLAARLDDAEGVLEHWKTLSSFAEGDEPAAGDETSALLLGALAASEALGASGAGGRGEARELIVERWIAGRLCLPDLKLADTPGRLPVWMRVLTAELQAMGAAPDPRLVAWLDEQLAQGVAARFGGLPRELQGGGADLRLSARDVFVFVASDGDGDGALFRGGVGAREDVLPRLSKALTASPIPEGFSVAITGNESAGELVRIAQRLSPGLEYAVHHDDPEEFIASAGHRFGLLRGALVLLGVLAFAACAISAAALRRQRRLQEQKERFIASVSHELRTPVSSILLTTESLVEGRARTPERLARYHGLVRSEALRLQRLVENVLDITRIGRGGGVRLEPAEVALTPFVEKLIDDCREQVEAANISFESAADLQRSAGTLDAESLGRAVRNLVENAILHAGSERVRIEVDVPAHRGELTIRVIDFGRGLNRRDAALLFEPFQQGTNGTAPSRGAGLGLAIVREIARAHGGDATLEPRAEGRGSCFQITIPFPTPSA